MYFLYKNTGNIYKKPRKNPKTPKKSENRYTNICIDIGNKIKENSLFMKELNTNIYQKSHI